MLIRRLKKTLFTAVTFVVLVLSLVTPGFAASPRFLFNPTTGYVKPGNEFTVDILIDTAAEKVLQARAVVTFDPTLVTVIKAEKNESLFCNWPTSEQSIDNTNGVIMLTGFCQAGNSELYSTTGTPDVFGRITFKALKEGKVKFDWEYSGEDQPFKSVLLKNGSPPTNILSEKPGFVTFDITNNTGTSGGTSKPTNIPYTAVTENKYLIYIGGGSVVLGILLFLGGGYLFNRFEKLQLRKNRTLVIYD